MKLRQTTKIDCFCRRCKSSCKDMQRVGTADELKTDRPCRCQFHQHFMSSFCTKILLPKKLQNPNCKLLKAVQRTLVWLSISPIFYKQLFHTKVHCAPIICLQFGFVIFWQKDLGAKAAHKMLVKLTPGACTIKLFTTVIVAVS